VFEGSFFQPILFNLDKEIKEGRLCIRTDRDPCLFSTGNGANNVKSSKALLINFAKDYLSGEGDIEKHLRQLRFRVEHEQSILSEVHFSVTNLAVDLRDGVRLAKLAEIVLKRHDICSALRMPAVSGAAVAPIQKLHNLKVVLKALESISIVFGDAEKVAKDVS
jgi:abnormal spindle-like microcephaly-associated protein